MDLRISRLRSRLVEFSLFVYDTPIPVFFGLIVILIVVGLTRSATDLVFALILGVYASTIFWVLVRRLAVSWQGVLLSARDVPAHPNQVVYRTQVHFAVLRRYLTFELGSSADDLLTVETPVVIRAEPSSERRSSIDLVIHGLQIGLIEDQLRLFGNKPEESRGRYVRELEEDLKRSDTSIRGILGFVVESYSKLDARIVRFSMRVRRNQSILDAIESHKTLVTLLLVFTAIVAAAILRFPLGLSL